MAETNGIWYPNPAEPFSQPAEYLAGMKGNANYYLNSKMFTKVGFDNLAPLIAPDVWAATTTYDTGDFVSSNGNYYMCWIGGTTASAAPTSTGSAPILDGTVKWYYITKEKLALGDVPSYTIGARDVSHTKYWEAANPTYKDSYTYTGGVYAVDGVGIKLPSVNVAPSAGNSMGTYNATNNAVHFYTDATTFTIQGRSVWYSTREAAVYIDDKPMLLGNIAPDSTLNPCGLNLDFTGYEKKVRKISFYWAANDSFYGVYTKPTDRVWPVKSKTNVVWVGDSLIAGANSFPSYMSADVCTRVAQQTGIFDVVNCGSGGTGFIADNGGNKTNHNNRLSDFTAHNPDVLIIAGCHNDAGYTDVEQLSAYTQFLNAFRAAMPDCRIIVFGTCYGSTADPSSFENADNNLKQAIDTIGDDNTEWVPVATSPSPWIFGVGNDSDQRGEGNVDFFQSNDSTHPNQVGIFYRADNYATEILSL
jgi:lysophospholipase L1-like esterase